MPSCACDGWLAVCADPCTSGTGSIAGGCCLRHAGVAIGEQRLLHVAALDRGESSGVSLVGLGGTRWPAHVWCYRPAHSESCATGSCCTYSCC